ncbi:hypothetical protein ACFPES_13940 [Paenibacillus sp. GCM10023248]|uniref:hypothetical protein n=1 Tax=Bacillales TaxID=1385 RepID=UPI0023799013|nr:MULTISPECIES: hypothetical protein [Bacillales]MDD9268134.1 hypothetical protein [Paenibacillus sp. MAHUQ-63]MDR6879813.1 putative hemolysin [Bacillus sp. 3255]
MIYFLVLIPVLIVCGYGLYKVYQKVRDKTETSKVIQLSLYQEKKKAAPGKQACSFCRKKEKKLAFYADEKGTVVGVCQECRPQAERRALMRL